MKPSWASTMSTHPSPYAYQGRPIPLGYQTSTVFAAASVAAAAATATAGSSEQPEGGRIGQNHDSEPQHNHLSWTLL